jgi:predicted branched-subunit amino acid permease
MEFREGIKSSIPIAMGYFPVSFTFGMIASGMGIDPSTAFAISATNFTSAGQFAGLNVMVSSGGYMEVALTTFIINIRYMLMSLSLSQKMESFSILDRMIVGFGITDETFAVSSIEREKLSKRYMLGLIAAPYLSWGLGTLSGALVSGILSQNLKAAMGIALYGMFLAIIVPEARKSREVTVVAVFAAAVSGIFKYVPAMGRISQGWVIIVATLTAAGLGAVLFPRGDE